MIPNLNKNDVYGKTKKNRAIKPNVTAIIMFAKGPAAATLAEPYFLSLRFKGLIGTGFAQPKTILEPITSKRKGKSTEPIGSKCFRGFKVNLPANFAVGSPR